MQPNFYAILPATIRYDKDLSSSEKLFYAELTAMAHKEGYAWASNKYFAELYGVSNSTVSLWIKHLSELGHVELEYIKEGKQIVKRLIYPIQKIERGYSENQKGGSQKIERGYSENLKENSTSNNITSNNNTRGKKASPPPTFEEFREYAEQKALDNNLDPDFQKLRFKFESWKENDWKTGHGRKIKNWKSTLLNTLPHLQKEKSSAQKESRMDKLRQV